MGMFHCGATEIIYETNAVPCFLAYEILVWASRSPFLFLRYGFRQITLISHRIIVGYRYKIYHCLAPRTGSRNVPETQESSLTAIFSMFSL